MFAAIALAACAQPSPPNVLLVTLDTTRADRLGPYGFGGGTTPALDRFARTAVVYERAYATSSWTLPSHASLFTGLLPMQHGAQTAPDGDSATLGYAVRPLAPSFRTLAEHLSAAGYRTAAVIAGPALKRELGVAQGFETYDDDLGGPAGTLNGRRAADVTDRAIERLREFGEGPWFLFVNYFDPHAPYRPPPPYDRGLPATNEAALTKRYVEQLVRGDPPRAPAAMDAEERALVDALLAGYDAEIAYMDRHLGRLLAAVDESTGGAGTFVAITADHGESFGEHHYVSHGAHLYEDNVRVPLIVRWPDGAEAGGRRPEPVQNHRLFATVLEVAGQPAPEGGLRDRAAAPIVTEVGPSDANVRLFGPFFDRRLVATYEGPRKLIESSKGGVELYDLSLDPLELDDLAAHDLAAHDAALAPLRERLDAVRAAHPPLYDAESRARLEPETEEALRALGYLE